MNTTIIRQTFYVRPHVRARSLFQLSADGEAGSVTTAHFAAWLAYWDARDVDGIDRHVEQLKLNRNTALSRGNACRLIYQMLASVPRGVAGQGGERD